MKKFIRLLAIALLLLLLAAAALPFLIDANRFRPMLESELTKSLGREVKVGGLKLALFSGGVTASDLSVADDPSYSHTPFVHTQSLTLGVELWPLIFSRELHIKQITLTAPQIDLVQSASGAWNFSSLGARHATPSPSTSTSGLDLSVKLIKISNGRLTFAQQNSGMKPRILENVMVDVRDFSTGAAFPFDLAGKLVGGGTLQLSGTGGPIDATDVAQTPAKLKLKISGFDLAAAEIDTEGGLAGLVSIDGDADSNGKTLSVTGRLTAQKLKLAKNGMPAAEPVELDISVAHDMRKNSGALKHGGIHMGSAVANLAGVYAPQGRTMTVKMDLDGPSMPVPQLAAMLPAFGIALPAGSHLEGGAANAKMTFAGTPAALTIDGNLGLSDTRLTGFDLGSKVSRIEKLAGVKTGPNTDIKTFSATVHLSPGGSSFQDILLEAPALGQLSGSGGVSATQDLDFKMRASLHTGGAALALIGAKSAEGIPFTIGGTATNPEFRPDVKGIVSQEVHGLENPLGKAGSALGGIFHKKK